MTMLKHFLLRLYHPPSLVLIMRDHGCIETRSIRVTDDIAWLQERHDWESLQSIIVITAEREIDNKITEETRYFISSLDANAPDRLERVVRAHWSIENNLHWVLDIAFDEDSNRTSKGRSAANLAVIRHIALNLIKTEKKNLRSASKSND